MSTLQLVMMIGGLFGTLVLIYSAFAGPSASRALSRRLEKLRERHSASTEVAAQVQLKRILAHRDANRIEGFAQQFIPKPALLGRRIEQTGRDWSLGQYAMVSAGIAVVVGLLITIKSGVPLLGIAVGLFAGLGLPHF